MGCLPVIGLDCHIALGIGHGLNGLFLGESGVLAYLNREYFGTIAFGEIGRGLDSGEIDCAAVIVGLDKIDALLCGSRGCQRHIVDRKYGKLWISLGQAGGFLDFITGHKAECECS